eukprot:528759_1
MIHHCIYTTLSKYDRITNTPINTTLNNHYHYSPFQNTLQQHSQTIIFNPQYYSLAHIPQQFVGLNQPQVVPLNQFHCYNNSTMLLFLQLYLIYYILINMYIMYQLQFVDCLQPQVVILSSLYYSKLNAFSHILTTTTIKNITKYLWFQYEQLLRAAFSHMIRTTTTTESIIKYTAYPSKTLLYQYEQSLRDTYAPEPSPKCIYTPVPLSKDKIYIETSCGLLIVILFIEISRGLLDVRLDAFSNIFTTTTTTTTKSTTLSSPYYVQLDVSSN